MESDQKQMLTRKQFVAMGTAALTAIHARRSEGSQPESPLAQSRREVATDRSPSYDDPHKVELRLSVTEVAPGVYRLRAGRQELLVPSSLRGSPRLKELGEMPRVVGPPSQAIRVWRLARGCRIELPLGAAETIYGMGLQCRHLEQNGWRRTIYADAGDNDGSGMSHAPVPFYASPAGYGVLIDSARCVTFSVGEARQVRDATTLSHGNHSQIESTNLAVLYGPHESKAKFIYADVPAARGVDIYWFGGPDMGDAIARYNLFSGGGCMPPMSGLGPHYIFGTMLNASSVLAMSDQIKSHGIPITTVGLEPGWQTHAYSSSYLWDIAKFPDNFGEIMHRKGYDLYLWCQLYLDPSCPLIKQLHKGFGDFAVWHGLVPDIMDAQVRRHYADFLHKNFIGRSIGGFKLDEVDGSNKTAPAYQSWMFPDFTSFPSGADGEQTRNVFGRCGAQGILQAFRKGDRRTFGLVRASQAWAAPIPMAVYSDEYSLHDYVRYNLSAGVQGLIWSPEIRDAGSPREWALRVATAAFSAKMVYNGWQFPHLIWQNPDLSSPGKVLSESNAYTKLARYFNRLRMALLPYIYQAYSRYHLQGVAPVRPLVADWPSDVNTQTLDDQWMLGSDILVAPLTDRNAFSHMHRVVLTHVGQVNPDPGVKVQFEAGVLSLDIVGVQDGLPGGGINLTLRKGPCVARMLARGDIRVMDTRLRQIAPGSETDVGAMYHDNIALDPEKWRQLDWHFDVPADGNYRLMIGKGYWLRLKHAKNLQIKNLSFEQRSGDPATSWKRMVYLPTGIWRDFWTGAAVSGGHSIEATAAPEQPPVFVRDNTLLPLAEPMLTFNVRNRLKIHLAAYGSNPGTCQLREDDGATFAYEKGEWATLTVHPDGKIIRPKQGQPRRYQIVAPSREASAVLHDLLTVGA